MCCVIFIDWPADQFYPNNPIIEFPSKILKADNHHINDKTNKQKLLKAGFSQVNAP